MTTLHPIHVLWAHPRSASTAFERVMRARGDLDCLHEPFLPYYYVDRGMRTLPHYEPDPAQPITYDDIRAMIFLRAESGPVFVKDMAYYVLPALLSDEEFRAAMRPVFMVRDPAAAILSYARLDPEFTQEELGYEAQLTLFDAFCGAGSAPIVLSSERLRADPETEMRRYWAAVGLTDAPGAFSWDGAAPEDWGAVAGWHGDVLKSGGVLPPTETGDAAARVGALGPRYEAMRLAVTPAYEALCARVAP